MRRNRSAGIAWRLLGVGLAVAGTAIIIRLVPPFIWLFLVGILLIIFGWRLYIWGQEY